MYSKSRYKELNSKEWLVKEYIEEELSTTKIAEKVGCNPVTVWNHLKKFGIPIRSHSEAIRGEKNYWYGKIFFKHKQLADKDWLYEKYWTDGLSTREIAEIVNCDPATIFSALRRHNIKTRTLSEANQGERSFFWGKHHTQESKDKMSASRIGMKFTDAHKKNISKALEGREISAEHKQKIRENRKHRVFPKHHTEPERIFEAICKKYNLPFKYTGDSRFWIDNINPDFVECNGKKIAVEIFGDYWHSPLLNPKLRVDRTLPYRQKALKKYGWKLIVFWESDLKRKDAEQFVLMKLQGKY